MSKTINEPEIIMSPEYYKSMKPELDKLFAPAINSQTKESK